MTIKKWLANFTTPLNGKRVVITGATGGLGAEICDHFLALGADITMACRNEIKATALKEKLILKHPNTSIDFISLDLTKKSSVDEAIKQLKAYNGIDIIAPSGIAIKRSLNSEH